MASECKLCALLGATNPIDISHGNKMEAHNQLHVDHLHLINRPEGTVGKRQIPPIRSDTKTRNGRRVFPKEKSRKSALFKFCRELVKSRGKDCTMECSQCKRSVKSRRKTNVMTYGIINHACIHLNKHLFSCCHCDFMFVTKVGISRHLRNIHALRSSITNYIDMTKNHLDDIKDMVRICFGKAPQKQLNITTFGKQKRNPQVRERTPLVNLAYSFVKRHSEDSRIQCQLCPRSIAFNRPSLQSEAARSLLDHARWHVDKPLFRCHICQYSASMERTIIMHLRTSHSVAQSRQNFKDLSSEYVEEISSMLEDCFGDMKKERPSAMSMEEKRSRHAQSSIRSRCGTNELLAERQLRCKELAQRFQQSGKLQCRICHMHQSIASVTKTAYVSVTMRHALAHLNKILFTCRRCSYTSTTMNAIGDHIRTNHGVPVTNEFDDHTNELHAEFMDILSKCFDWDLEPNAPEDSVKSGADSRNNTTSILPRTHGNDLKAARLVCAHELIRKHATGGIITCRICSQNARTTKEGNLVSRYVFGHVMNHLGSRFRPYRCKLCSFISAHVQSTHKHLKYAHKSDNANEIEDMSDKYHEEIMECLAKCYDWSIEGV